MVWISHSIRTIERRRSVDDPPAINFAIASLPCLFESAMGHTARFDFQCDRRRGMLCRCSRIVSQVRSTLTMSVDRLKVAFLGPLASFSHQVPKTSLFSATSSRVPRFLILVVGCCRVLWPDVCRFIASCFLRRCLRCCTATESRLRRDPLRKLYQWVCRPDIGPPCGSQWTVQRRESMRGVLLDSASLFAGSQRHISFRLVGL